MAQLWKIRLPNGRTLTPSDWTSAEPLYSTVEIGTGPFPVLTAFGYGQGGEVPGSPGARKANLADTNLEGEGGRLPENEELICYQIAVEFYMIGTEDPNNPDPIPAAEAPNVSLLNMLRLQRDILLVWRFSYNKEYMRAPIGYFPASSGTAYIHGGYRNAVAAGTTGGVIANNGGTDVCDMREFASPIYVGPGEAFAIDIKPGPGGVADLNLDPVTNSRIRARVLLEGYRRRPVA